MNFDSDQLLYRLVVAALTIFVVASLLLGALVVRELWLQQRIAGLSSNVQTNLEELEETRGNLEGTLSDMRTTPENDQQSESWDDVAKLLADVDQRLDSIEEDMDDVETVLGSDTDMSTAEDEEDAPEAHALQDRVDQVFTIFAVLVGIAAILIAVLLEMAMAVEERASVGEKRR